MKTYLSVSQIERLAEVFANEEQFTEHLKTLWALRRTVCNKLETDYPDTYECSPLYKIFKLTNELINAIDDGTVYIANGEVQVNKKYKIER